MQTHGQASDGRRRLLNKPDAAEYLTVGERTLCVLVASGELPVIRVSKRRIAFDIADLDRYIAQQRSGR